MIRRPPRSTQSRSSAASDVYKRQVLQLTGLEQMEAAEPKETPVAALVTEMMVVMVTVVVALMTKVEVAVVLMLLALMLVPQPPVQVVLVSQVALQVHPSLTLEVVVAGQGTLREHLVVLEVVDRVLAPQIQQYMEQMN